jgi:Uma2 family endonuclease
MASEPVRHLFSVAEYERMNTAGLFAGGQRLELVGGEIVEMAPIGSPHASVVGRLTRLLVLGVSERAVVWVQNPVRLNELSEVQPDVALLRPRRDFYASGHPGPEDVLLLIEVADTTGRWDRAVKRPLYAAAGIGEVWIVDLPARMVEVADHPGRDDYDQVRQAAMGETITPAAFPDLAIEIAEILG